ncbi:MAG: hypothetical protein OXE99_00950 [Cellvibrionales bacterium]|nr:hypothetical protein [Cellvibrionales bacterium]
MKIFAFLLTLVVGASHAATVVHSTFSDDYLQDDQGLTGWYIFDDHTGSKGNPLVHSPTTGKTYHGITRRDVNQGYYQRKFMCANKSKVSWSADVFYCSPSSSTTNTVHTYFNDQDFGAEFGWVKMGTGTPYVDASLINAGPKTCNDWEFKKIMEPDASVDDGEAPIVEAGEVFDLKFKFRLIGGNDYAAVSNFKLNCTAIDAGNDSGLADLEERVTDLEIAVSTLETTTANTNTNVMNVESEQASLSTALGQVQTSVANTTSRVTDAEFDIADISDELQALNTKVDSIDMSQPAGELSCNTYSKGFSFSRSSLYCADPAETMVSCNTLRGVQTDSEGKNYCSGSWRLQAVCCSAQ